MVYFPGDDLFARNRPRGLPIGNLTSQFWANCYLNSLDHFIKRDLKCPGFVRYVDDLLLFADSKEFLWKCRHAVVQKLSELRLSLHPHAHPQPQSEGLPFLGFILYPDRRRVKNRKAFHFQRKLKGLVAHYEAGMIELDVFKASIQGWVNHVRFGNTIGLRKLVLEKVRIRKSGNLKK